MRIDREILPYPIAMAYQRIHACHGKDARRLKHILQTAEMVARFLGIVALSDLRDQIKAERFGTPEGMGQRIRKLRRPSFGDWIEIVRETTRVLRACTTAFMPELAGFVFKSPSGSLSTPFDLLSGIVNVRNRFAHGDMRPPEIVRACDETEQAMNAVLAALSFIEQYHAYYVRRISVRKRRLEQGRYDHDFWLMSGPYVDPMAVSEPRPWHTDANEVIIMKPDGAYLNLDPLVVFHDGEGEYADTSITPGMYIFNGYQRKGNGLDVAYLPCGPGRELCSADLPDENWRALLSQGVMEFAALMPDKDVEQSHG